MRPTRFEINGVRYYYTDRADKAYPSVTAILSRTATDASKKALLTWNERNPGAREAAAERGTAIHSACENYIRGLPTNLPDQYRPYWDGLAKHLDRYDYFIWSEKPLNPQWDYCVGEDGISRLWSHQYGYCGLPDLIGVRNGVTILADFKTSVGPYCRYYPKDTDRSMFGGWNKFNKCSVQLAAYAIAAKETIGVTIDAAQILVSTPDLTQSFYLYGDDLVHYRHKWLVKVRKFYELQEQQEGEGDNEPMNTASQ